MKKIILLLAVLTTTILLSSCVEINVGTVTEIELSFIPEVAYIKDTTVSFVGETVEVSFSDREPVILAMDDSRVTVTGNGVKYVSGAPRLNTDDLGPKTLRVAYDNVSITLSFYVANLIVNSGGSIQDTIDLAVGGETIVVESGIYDEAVEVNKPGVTIKALGDVTVRNYDKANPTVDEPLGEIGFKVTSGLGTITIEGFTVTGFRNGISQGMAAAEGTSLHVINNTVEATFGSIMRNGIQVTGTGGYVSGNTVYGAPLNDDWASTAIQVVNADNVIVENNVIIGRTDLGTDIGIGIMNYSIDDTSGVEVRNNTINNAKTSISITGKSGETPAKTVSNVVIDSNTISIQADPSVSYILLVNVQTVAASNIIVTNNQLSIAGTLWAGYRVSDSTGAISNSTVDGEVWAGGIVWRYFG